MQVPLLDRGYLKLVECWGTGEAGKGLQEPPRDGEKSGLWRGYEDYECGIVEAARMSTQGGFRGWDQDEKLLAFLYSNDHDSPFEFGGMIVEVCAPLVVFREWHRHRTGSYNEASGRYGPLPALYYMPSIDRLMLRETGTDKQAAAVAGAPELTLENAEEWQRWLTNLYNEQELFYQWGLSVGIPKELARLDKPLGHYSYMRAQMNLRNWLAFMTLRMDPKAQWEIRQYAWIVAKFISDNFPRTWEQFRLTAQYPPDVMAKFAHLY